MRFWMSEETKKSAQEKEEGKMGDRGNACTNILGEITLLNTSPLIGKSGGKKRPISSRFRS